MTINLLNEAESKQVRNLLADKSLDYLMPFEKGEFHALTSDGELLGYIQASNAVANTFNRCRIAEQQMTESAN